MTNGHDQTMFRAVVDTTVDGVIGIDGDGTVRIFNPACERLLGYSADEVVGENVTMIMPQNCSHAHAAGLADHLHRGAQVALDSAREVEALRKDGTAFPMELSIGESQHCGKPLYVATLRDLTERKRSEQAAREAVARLKTVVDTAVDGVIQIDSSGIVLTFNPACERLFGYSADEVVGENVSMLMPPHYRDAHDGYIDNYLRTGERKIIGIPREAEAQTKYGTVFPINLSVGEAEQDGASVFVGTIHDLTERKTTERQLAESQKMNVVGQLAAGIAHDFNNLLTVVIGQAERLGLELKSQPDLQEVADSIIGAGERGAELTRRLLAFGRKQYLEPERVDLDRLIDKLRNLLHGILRADIDVSVEFVDNPSAVIADPAQLESAVLNLCLNAQEAMPDGGRLIIATSEIVLDPDSQERKQEVPPSAYMVIAITDTGEGMDPDVLARAFEPFFTTKKFGTGSGLGLSMVHGFVKQSNGHVTIYSQPNLGTTIRLYLPSGDGPTTALKAAPSAPMDRAVPEPLGDGETILIVEDDPLVRNFAELCVQSFGYDAITAESSDDALRKFFEAGRIDVLFTDLVMPGGLSGWEVAERIRGENPDVHVIFSSGYAIESLKARRKLPEGVAFLGKPYRKAQLARCLKQAISGPT